MQQPAEAVNPLNNITTVELMPGHPGDRRFEVDAAMWALLVVMVHELPQYALGMAFTADKHPVQAGSMRMCFWPGIPAVGLVEG